MIRWSTKRKIFYASIIFVVFFVALLSLYFLVTYEKPNCFDGLKNQEEFAIDCGGSCENLCSSQVKAPNVLWSKAFQITPGFWNVAAFIENSNMNAVSDSVPYVFKLKNPFGEVVAERKGQTTISNSRLMVIFESGFALPQVSSLNFEFVGDLTWRRDNTPTPEINIKKKVVSREDISPRLEVTLENRSGRNISRLEVAAIVFASTSEPIAVSRTFIDDFYVNLVEDLVFTWPQPFSDPATIDILTREISE